MKICQPSPSVCTRIGLTGSGENSCVKIDVIDEDEIDVGCSPVLEARNWIKNVDTIQGHDASSSCFARRGRSALLYRPWQIKAHEGQRTNPIRSSRLKLPTYY